MIKIHLIPKNFIVTNFYFYHLSPEKISKKIKSKTYKIQQKEFEIQRRERDK